MDFFISSAEACSVCYSALPASRNAYYLATLLMTLLPILLLAGIFFWFRLYLFRGRQRGGG